MLTGLVTFESKKSTVLKIGQEVSGYEMKLFYNEKLKK
jgi:hypothetical protein